MLEFFKKKTIANYINLASAVLAIVMAIVFSVYSNTYALFNVWVLLCLIAAAVLNIVLFILSTSADEYIKIVAALLSALAMALFVVTFIGDITDYFNGVNFLGRGADIGDIVTVTIFLGILLVLQIVVCFFGKKTDR